MRVPNLKFQSAHQKGGVKLVVQQAVPVPVACPPPVPTPSSCIYRGPRAIQNRQSPHAFLPIDFRSIQALDSPERILHNPAGDGSNGGAGNAIAEEETLYEPLEVSLTEISPIEKLAKVVIWNPSSRRHMIHNTIDSDPSEWFQSDMSGGGALNELN